MKTQVSTLALALLLMTGMAVAQEKQQMPGQQERGGGKAEGGNRGGDARRSEGAGRSAPRENAAPRQERSSGSATRGQSSGTEGARRQSQDAPAMKEPRRSAQDRVDRSKQNAERPQPENKAARTKTETNKAAPKTGEATPKAEPKNRTATEPPRKQDTNRATQGAGSGEAGRAANTPRDTKSAAPTREGSNNAPNARSDRRVELSTEQRDRVRTVFHEQRPRRVSNIRVNINIGQRVPRNVSLYAIPAAVLAIVPEYRSYRYVYVEDRYVIVDPATYEIVYVIDDTGAVATTARPTALVLTPGERQILLRGIDFQRAQAHFSFRMALGAEVPDRVELYRFPAVVLDNIPKLERYRYVVVDNNVLVVDPGSRGIILVIES